ncbi:hypothetical protein MXB_4822, partial [Myxobolus squamalis]
PFDDAQVARNLQNILHKINFCVLEILKNTIFKVNENFDILKTDLFKRYISFHSIFSVIRIFGHSAELSTSVIPLVHKMIHLNNKLDNNVYFTPSETMLTFLCYFTQNILVLWSSANFLYELMDFLFVLETLLNLVIKQIFNQEFVIQFLEFFDRFLSVTEKNEIQFKNHIDISAVKIIDALINGACSINIDHLDLLIDDPSVVNQVNENSKKIKKIPANTIIVKKLSGQPISDVQIKEINLKLVDTQNKEYFKKGISFFHNYS